MAAAAGPPPVLSIWPTISPRDARSPRTRLATPTTISSKGASENVGQGGAHARRLVRTPLLRGLLEHLPKLPQVHRCPLPLGSPLRMT
jgi:hypothetical protein